ncbi:MAG: FtsH protease activity modulator HflK [Candidatus Eisenbacteria bacterium]
MTSPGDDMRDTRAPSERFLQDLASFIVRRGRWILGAIAGIVVVVWLATGFYTVENGSIAVVRRFGAISEPAAPPGLHFRMPNGIEREMIFPTGEVHRLEVSGDNGVKLDVITGDENIVATSLVVQYRVTDAARYLFGCDLPEELVLQSVRAAVLETAGAMLVDDLLTTGKARIQNDVRSRAQELLRDYGSGISLLTVTLQSIEPPTEAAAAFRSVQDSRSESARTISDGRMLSDHMLSLTRAEASRMVEEAQAESEGRVHGARGAAERFGALLTEYRRSPEQTREDLLQEKLADVLPRTEVFVLAPGESPRLDLQLESTRKPTTP